MSTSVESRLGSYFLAKNLRKEREFTYRLVTTIWPWFEEVFDSSAKTYAFTYIDGHDGWGQNRPEGRGERAQYFYLNKDKYTLFETRMGVGRYLGRAVFKPCPYCGMDGTPEEKGSLSWDDIKKVVLGVEVCEGPLPHLCGPCADWHLEHDGEAPPWAVMKRD